MLTRIFGAAVLGCLLVVPVTAQTVRFDTNVGNIDLLLNPTNDPNLQPNVDNILAYVNAGLYDLTVLNRAAEGFVLQYGGFSLDPMVIPDSSAEFIDVPRFDPVIVDTNGDNIVDFNSLSNVRGTVSLALSSNPDGSTNVNSGTNSFFVNVGDNSASLDAQGFVPFAVVQDLSTVDLILSLPQESVPGGGLASQDFPTVNNAGVVFVERAFVLEDQGPTSSITFSTLVGEDVPSGTMVSTTSSVGGDSGTVLSTTSTVVPVSNAGPVTFSNLIPNPSSSLVTTGSITASTAALATSSAFTSSSLTAIAVPEPPALVLAIGALVLIYIIKPQRIQ